MDTQKFNYKLPPKLIAQEPVTPRDSSRLFVVCTPSPRTDFSPLNVEHRHFYDLVDYLNKDDVLVFNNSKVFPARLFGTKKTGGKIETLLLEEKSDNTWRALLKPGKGSKETTISFGNDITARITGRDEEVFTLEFNKSSDDLNKLLDKLGVAPTPPYIKKAPEDLKKYQTVYAKERGSVAAPTAGFHFTKKLLRKLKNNGVQFEYVTLHVGLGTFQPVKDKKIEKHKIHTERYSIKPETWERIKKAKKENKRIIAVGTTSCRVLETLGNQKETKLQGDTDIFILPGYNFRIIDSLITNFHLPESTLLILLAAFIGDKIQNPEAGIKYVQNFYQQAIEKKYRFYSFGDAMFLT